MAYSAIEENERLQARIAAWQTMLEDGCGLCLVVAEEMAATLEE